MTRKTLSQDAAELLLSGQATLVCPACGESNWAKAGPADQTKKPGLLTVRCKTCRNAASSAYSKKRLATDPAFREAEKARSSAYHKERLATDPAYRESENARSSAYKKERYATDEVWRESQNASSLAYSKKRYATDEAFRESENARSSAYHKERYATDEAWREAQKVASLQWAKDNPGKVNALSAKRRSKKLQATPAWADLSTIQAFYEACPEGYHVDHIVPLQGDLVSGLHVLDNLQYLTAFENISKSNTFEV